MKPSLSPEQVETAARELTDARRSVTSITDLGENAPRSLSSALAIAERHSEQLGLETAGWKIGCTSEHAMQLLNSPGPFPGRVYEGCVYWSHVLDHAAMINPGIECEFVFMLGRDLPATEHAYSIEDVKAATKSVAPAFELVAPRFGELIGIDYLSLIADSGANGGVVFGEPIDGPDWPDLAAVTVELEIDGAPVSNGVGSAILGDPWLALQWLANHLSSRQIGLHASEFVMSGTCTGFDPLPPGSVATGRYSNLGSVEIRRTDESG